MTRVLHAVRISNVDSGMFLNSIRKKVNLELGKRNKEMFFVLSRAWKKDKKHEETKEREKKLHIVTNEIVRVEGFINFIKQKNKKTNNSHGTWIRFALTNFLISFKIGSYHITVNNQFYYTLNLL